MTNRKKIIIIGSVVLLGVITLIAVVLLSNKSPEPTAVDTTPEKTTSTTSPEKEKDTEHQDTEQHSDSDATDSHVHGEPLPQATQDAIKYNATQAAEAYVVQPSGEEPAARQARLARFFAPSSPVITAGPPVPVDSYHTSQITLLESSWYNTEKEGVIGVIVYMKIGINTGFETRDEYQTWVVELIQHDGAWLSQTITKSDLPYIQGAD